MCGIAGLVSRHGPIRDLPDVTRAFDAALAHRGPDGRGAWSSSSGDALLVHRRLAIIDPGPRGAQPLATPDGRHRLVFNGEVYNYRELRRELEGRGERFDTESDTEVLLRLVARDGPGALARVRGMFAFACWDERERSVLVARDRYGIKPLYVAAGPDRLAFASEIGALRAAGIGHGPSPAGVLAFLRWGSIPPPLTIACGVEALEPGTWREWGAGGEERRGRFADSRTPYVAADRDARPSDAEYRAAVGSALRDSVRAHLVADVPVGVFLSGGIDSAALVSAAASAGASRLQTFTVAFDDPTSEAAAARTVAAAFDTDHHELRIAARDIADDFPRILDRLDQPTIDGVNTFYVARAVAANGIKSVLSGIGGDEVFGGYPSFRRLPYATAGRRISGRAFRPLARVMGVGVPSRLRARWDHFVASDGALSDAYRVQRGFLLPNEIEALAGPALRDKETWRAAVASVDAAEQRLLAPLGPERAPAGVARLETRLYLASQLLRDTDVMAMTHALEVRVPFVDDQLIATVWPRLGVDRRARARKRLLWETLEAPLPASIVDQPKQGFTLPFARWLGGELAPIVDDGLQLLARSGWIESRAAAGIEQAWRDGRVHWSRIWGLAVLGHHILDRGGTTETR